MTRKLKLKYKMLQSAAAMAAAIGTGSILASCADWKPFAPGMIVLAVAGYVIASGLYWIESLAGGVHREN